MKISLEDSLGVLDHDLGVKMPNFFLMFGLCVGINMYTWFVLFINKCYEHSLVWTRVVAFIVASR